MNKFICFPYSLIPLNLLFLHFKIRDAIMKNNFMAWTELMFNIIRYAQLYYLINTLITFVCIILIF